jgi:NADH-ubiquinone oxidoreductase chain 2
LIIGTILGLTQSRIKRLFAYSTISHLGFILLSLTVCSVESNQAFIFYLIQYTISNLNAFFLLLCMGYLLFFYINNNIEFDVLKEKNNSPIQLINQIKGYYNINSILTLSLSITLLSFAGIPPLIGFFGKQMVLSSALDSGYLFLVLIAILTSVIGAVYYLNIIKKMYFDDNEYKIYTPSIFYNIQYYNKRNSEGINLNNITISSYLSIIISILTLTILLFILAPKELLNMTNILALIIYT